MTFSLPAALAAQFVKRVSARDRSRYVAEALASRLRERDRLLARAAEVANRSRQVRVIEQEFNWSFDGSLQPYPSGKHISSIWMGHANRIASLKSKSQ